MLSTRSFLSTAIHTHGQKLLTRSLATNIKKLDVTIYKEQEGKEPQFKIKLGDLILKTPAKKPLVIPDESLALAIAHEWRVELKKKKMNLANMHLTTLAYTAIDNPFGDSKEELVKSILEYLNFDTVRFRDVDNEKLLQWQSRHWDPIVGWFEHKYECQLPVEYNEITTTGALPQHTTDIMSRHLNSHGRWPLVGVNFITRNLKSLVLTTSLMERFLKVEQAVELARLETRFQTEKWSKVEWEHDLDEQCTNARVAAGALFYHLSV